MEVNPMLSPDLKDISIDLQERDLAFLCGLFESRTMTRKHVATLYFEDKEPYAKKRLQRIKAAGLITERRRLVNEPAILFLTRKALNLLKREGRLLDYPQLSGNAFEARTNIKEFSIRHELQVMDVKSAF